MSKESLTRGWRVNLKQRANVAWKVLTSQTLGNSLGSVVRNYGKQSRFRPYDQVQGITYKAIDKIGLSMSVYRPVVHKQNGDAFFNHPLYKTFDEPNPRQMGSDFIHLWAMLYEIYGETFWYLAKGELTGKTKEIYLLNPAQVKLEIENGELVGYTLHKENGRQVPLEVDEVIHDKRPNPFNEWRGLSVLERASIYIDTEITTSKFTLNYMHNNASPSGIVSLPDMSETTFKQFAQQWREGYEGPENAGKTAFIRGEQAKFAAVGATLKDVDQKITREMSEDDVLMMFDVPKELIGKTNDTGFGRNTVEAFNAVFAENKLEPMMRRLDGVYQKILTEIKSNDGYVGHASPIPEDKEYNLKLYEKGVNKWLTVNEIRQRQGLEPVKGGDELNPANATPEAQRVTTESVEPRKKVVIKKKTEKDLNDEQEEFRSDLVKRTEKYEKKLKRAITKFAENQEGKVIDRINATSKAFEEWLFEIKEQSEEFAGIALPIVIELMEEQAEGTAHFITGETIFVTDEIRKTVEQDILRIAGIYNQDTLKALEKTLAEGQTAGESLVKLKKRVETVYSDAKGYRAERIARTESLKAANRSAEMVYKANGFSKVQFFANPGACEFCAVFDGRTKEIGSNFINIGDVVTGTEGNQLKIDYDDVAVPPIHPQCRCSIIPI